MADDLITPDLSPASTLTGTADLVVPNVVSPEAKSYADNAADFAKFAVPGVIAGFADTVLPSLGIINEGKLGTTISSVYPAFGDYYSRNKEVLQTVGDMTGMLIPGMAATKFIQSGALIKRTLNVSGAGEKVIDAIFTSGRAADEAANLQLGARASELALAGSKNPMADSAFAKLATGVTLNKVLDSVKEAAAFEIGVGVTMHSSETLYPSDWSMASIIALNAGLQAPFVGAEYLFTQRAIRNVIKSMADPAERTLAQGAPSTLGDLHFRPGSRDIGITNLGVWRAAVDQGVNNPASGIDLKSTLNRVSLSIDGQLKDQFEGLGKDKIYPFTVSTSLSSEQTKSLFTAVDQDPSALLGTLSVETIPSDMKGIFDKINSKFEYLTKVDAQIAETEAKATKAIAAGTDNETVAALAKERSDLLDKKDIVSELQPTVVEASGEQVPAQMRKPRFTDGNWGIQIKTLPKTQTSNTTYIVEGINDDLFGVTSGKVGFTSDGLVILPKISPADMPVIRYSSAASGMQGEQVVMRTNIKQVVDPADFSRPEFQQNLLYQLGKVYHWNQGQLGQEIYGKLPGNVQTWISDWTDHSGGYVRKKMSNWIEGNTPEWQAIQAGFQPFRNSLHELADAYDGTILLWRGQAKEETRNPTNDIVSMTTNFNMAHKGFGGPDRDVVAIRVPIDDIIMPVGGVAHTDEFEVVVKGNLNRQFGDVVAGRAGAAPAAVAETPEAVNALAASAAPVTHYDQLGYKERSSIFGLIQNAVSKFKVGEGGPTVALHEGSHWTQLEYVQELIDKFGLDKLGTQLQIPAAWRGSEFQDKLSFATLRGKMDSYNLLQDMIDQSNIPGGLKLADNQRLNKYDLQYLLNLPANGNLGVSPVLGVFADLRAQGVRDLAEGIRNTEHFRRAMQEHSFMPELTNFLRKETPLRGNVLKTPEDATPVFTWKKNLTADNYNSDALMYDASMSKLKSLQTLQSAGQQGAPLTQAVADGILGSSAALEARDVGQLIEGTERGKGVYTQQSFASAGNSVMQAMDRIVSSSVKRIEKFIGDTFQPHLSNFTALRSADNAGSIFRFNQFEQSYRFGWRLSGDVKDLGDGNIGYLLSKNGTDAAYNAKLWEKWFGEKIGDGEVYLPSMIGSTKGQPIGVDQLGHNAIQSITQLSHQVLDETNVHRLAMGLGPINKKAVYLPPPNLARENVRHITAADGSFLHTVVGATPQEADNAARQAAEALIKENPELAGHTTIYKQEEVRNNFELQDQAFFNLSNYGDPLAQTGRGRGALGTPVIDTGVNPLNNMITSINNQFHLTGKRARALAFEGEINQAKQMNFIQPLTDKSQNSIWSRYVNLIYDGSPLTANTTTGKLYNSIENLYDSALAAVFDKVRLTHPNIDPFSPSSLAREISGGDTREFNQLQKQLGDYMPFRDVQEFQDKTLKVAAPPTMKSQFAKLNGLTTLLTLRMFELGQPLINMTSLATTMPAVIRALEKQGTESVAEWSKRVGAYGTTISEGDALATFSPTRALTTTMHRVFNDDGFRDLMEEAGKLGYFRQDVAEMVRTMTAPQEGYTKQLLRGWNDKYFSMLADKSEEIARQFAFGTGLHIAEQGMRMESKPDMYLFAHDFANKVIGDYRSHNRPLIFSGAVGMPLGLFQTFTWNYFQRILDYMENKQIKALATQYGMQAAVFGGRSVPGFTQFSDMFASGNAGDALSGSPAGISNPIDGLQNKFGSGVADIILNGALSTMTGIAMYSRGDSNMQRLPGLWNANQTPVWNLANNTFSAIEKTVGMFKDGGNYSNQRMAEILGTYMINRPLKNLFQMAAGVSVDKSGEVISNDVYNGLSIAARVVGMKPVVEAKQSETLYRMRTTELAQQEHLENLKENTRSAIRGGTIDEQKLLDGMRTYIGNGGSPNGYARWFRDTMISATVNKADRKLLDIMNDPSKGYDMVRLMHAMQPLDR